MTNRGIHKSSNVLEISDGFKWRFSFTLTLVDWVLLSGMAPCGVSERDRYLRRDARFDIHGNGPPGFDPSW